MDTKELNTYNTLLNHLINGGKGTGAKLTLKLDKTGSAAQVRSATINNPRFWICY